MNENLVYLSQFLKESQQSNQDIETVVLKKDTIPEELLYYLNISIIEKGLVMVYLTNEFGEEVVIDFKGPNQVLRPAVEMDKHKVGELKAIALQETKIHTLTRDFFCSCSNMNDRISCFYYQLLNDDITSTYQQIKLLKISDIETRYITFLEEHKEILNYITDRNIANYLGIHYTTLARLKRKLLFKG